MSSRTRTLVTLMPSMILACMLGLLGWFPYPTTQRVRVFGTLLSLYFIFLWSDWLVNRRDKPVVFNNFHDAVVSLPRYSQDGKWLVSLDAVLDIAKMVK